MAERGGFEPPIRLHVCRISSAVHSTTLPPLRPLPRRSGPSCSKVSRRWDDGRPDGAASNQPRHWSAPCERAGLLSKPGPRAQGPRDTIFAAGPHSGRVKSLAVLRCDCARRNAVVPRAAARWPVALAGSRPARSPRTPRIPASRGHPAASAAGRHVGHSGTAPRVSRARPSAVRCGVLSPVAGRTGRAALARRRPGVARAA
jgi:hypothetical protein